MKRKKKDLQRWAQHVDSSETDRGRTEDVTLSELVTLIATVDVLNDSTTTSIYTFIDAQHDLISALTVALDRTGWEVQS